MLASVSGCQVVKVDVLSSGEGETVPLYWANLSTAVTVGSMVSDPEEEEVTVTTAGGDIDFICTPLFYQWRPSQSSLGNLKHVTSTVTFSLL